MDHHLVLEIVGAVGAAIGFYLLTANVQNQKKIAVLEAQMKERADDIAEIKRDVKTLLGKICRGAP